MYQLGVSEYLAWVIYFAAIAASILAIFARVEIGFFFLVFFLPLQNILDKIYKLPLGNQFVDILAISVLLGCLIQRGGDREKFSNKTSLNVVIALYVLVTFVGLLWGSLYLDIDLPFSFENERLKDWKNLMLLPFLYFVSVERVRDIKNVWPVLTAILLSIFMVDFFFNRQFGWVRQWHYSHDMRVGGAFTYLGANEMAAFLAQYSMIILGLLLFEKRRLKMIFLSVIFVFTVYCLMYSFSRSGYLAFVIATAFLLLVKNKKLLLAFVIVLLIAPSLVPVSVIERIEMTSPTEEKRIQTQESDPGGTEGGKYDLSTEARFGLTEKAMGLFKASPVLGTGFRTYSELVGRDTHNNYAKVLAETGIIGFVIYMLLYFLALRSGWKLYSVSADQSLKGLGLGFTGCVLVNMLVNVSHDCWSYLNLMGFYWVILGLVVKSKLFVGEGVKRTKMETKTNL